MPGEVPGQTPGEVPGQAPGQTPGEQIPGEVPSEQLPGEPPTDVPGGGNPDDTPDETENPGETPDETPDGENPGETPDETPDGENPDGLTPAPGDAASIVTECTVVDVINTGTGTQRINIALQPGERLLVDEAPRGVLVGFDETSGELDYQPPVGRLPDFFEYRIVAADDSVRVEGRMDIRLDPLRIMPLGDSITHGVEVGTGNLDSPPVPLRVGYRQSLLDQLSAAGLVVDFRGQAGQRAGSDAGISDADNGGYPGVDISFISNLVQSVFTEQPIDAVLLHIGTNQTPL